MDCNDYGNKTSYRFSHILWYLTYLYFIHNCFCLRRESHGFSGIKSIMCSFRISIIPYRVSFQSAKSVEWLWWVWKNNKHAHMWYWFVNAETMRSYRYRDICNIFNVWKLTHVYTYLTLALTRINFLIGDDTCSGVKAETKDWNI